MSAPIPPPRPRPGAEPLVSVIVPTHNRPQRLPGALGSVLAQTYRRLEVLVVDDASDQPVDVVVEQAAGGDRRVRLLRLPVNAGAAAARNHGLDAATGDLIAFLDDDDRWMPDKLARQVDHLQRHPDVGFVSCDFFHTAEAAGPSAPGVDPDVTWRRPVRFRGAARYHLEHLRWVNCAGSFSLVLADRRRLGDALRIDEAFRSVEDWDLWLRCAEVAPPSKVTEPLVHYVAHGDPRLTAPELKRGGLELFEHKHAASMTAACIAFHRAHQRMEQGAGLARRGRVLAAVAATCICSRRASALLLVEQSARQLGRLRGDPGLAERALVAALGW